MNCWSNNHKFVVECEHNLGQWTFGGSGETIQNAISVAQVAQKFYNVRVRIVTPEGVECILDTEDLSN